MNISNEIKSNYVNFNSNDLISINRHKNSESSSTSPDNESVYVAVGRDSSNHSFRSKTISENSSASFSETRSIVFLQSYFNLNIFRIVQILFLATIYL